MTPTDPQPDEKESTVLADIAPDPTEQLGPWIVGLLLVIAVVAVMVVLAVWLRRRRAR